jgi:pyrimidine operon attenuation protein/uracil phosphoribosyltransferase
MTIKRTNILDHEQIERKLQRMAWEIYENNHLANRLILIGIADNGMHIANAISNILSQISEIEILMGRIDLDKSMGLNADAVLSCKHEFKDEVVIMVDDVLNSGRIMFASLLPVLAQKPAKIQTAVLANRNHKAFPIKGDIVGISLATTLQEHIWFEIDNDGKMLVFLT